LPSIFELFDKIYHMHWQLRTLAKVYHLRWRIINDFICNTPFYEPFNFLKINEPSNRFFTNSMYSNFSEVDLCGTRHNSFW
jgi:hypothetical protein